MLPKCGVFYVSLFHEHRLPQEQRDIHKEVLIAQQESMCKERMHLAKS